MRSNRSLKSESVRTFSNKSLKTVRDGASKGVFYEADLDFEQELRDACEKFECQGVVVKRGIQNDEFYKNLKSQDLRKKVVVTKKMSMTTVSTTFVTEDSKKSTDNVTGSTTATVNTVESALLIVDALYDHQNELAEIMLSKLKEIPRALMQCIGLLCPYFKYLTKISIVKSRLNIYTLHELSKVLLISSLTDVCLDGSFLPEANYAILLNEKTKLRNLSLSRCRIKDEVCELIASKLHFTAPAAKNLTLLNLSCNHITDEGAKSLAGALRTNRCLRYLNLADNRITDEGALHLFDVLIEFPLTCDETIQKRARYMDYLKRKRAIYMNYYDDDADTRSLDEFSRKSATPKKSRASVGSNASRKNKKSIGDVDAATRAELMSLELLGVYVDPFSPDCTKMKDDLSYCLGNTVLIYLNLAYNGLSYLSMKRLKAVLLYQSSLKMSSNCGLMKVVLDGNPFPINCNEFDFISQLLVNSVFRAAPEGKRKASSAAKSIKK